MSDCVFCRKIETEDLVRSDRYGVVNFEPLHPVTPGHRLFVPEQHVTDAADQPDITGWTFAAAAEWARHNLDGDFNLITNAGSFATQTVMHLHVHLIPRESGDGLALPWATEQVRAEAWERGYMFAFAQERGDYTHSRPVPDYIAEDIRSWNPYITPEQP